MEIDQSITVDVKYVGDEYFWRTYLIIQQRPDIWGNFTYDDFLWKYRNGEMVDFLVAVVKKKNNDEVILGGAWLSDVTAGHSASINFFTNKKGLELPFIYSFPLAVNVLDHYFNKHNLDRIRGYIQDDNVKALRIAENLGFIRTGNVKAYLINNKPCNLVEVVKHKEVL